MHRNTDTVRVGIDGHASHLAMDLASCFEKSLIDLAAAQASLQAHGAFATVTAEHILECVEASFAQVRQIARSLTNGRERRATA